MVNLLSSRSFCGKQGENKPQHQHKISDRKTGDGRVAKWYTGGYFPVKHFLCCRDGYVHMEHLQHIIIHRWNGLNDISQAGARRVVVEGLQARNFPGEQSLFSLVRDGETSKHAYANFHISLSLSYLLGGGQQWLGCTRSHLAILRSFPSFLFFFYRMWRAGQVLCVAFGARSFDGPLLMMSLVCRIRSDCHPSSHGDT